MVAAFLGDLELSAFEGLLETLGGAEHGLDLAVDFDSLRIQLPVTVVNLTLLDLSDLSVVEVFNFIKLTG